MTLSLKALSLLLGLVGATSILRAQPQCTQGTPLNCVIAPATLEINLGALPVDRYWGCLNTNPKVIPSCSESVTVRDCIKGILANYRPTGGAGEPTGVRFLFGLGGGGYSTPFNPSGHGLRPWMAKFKDFLQDVSDAGYTKVTPTPVLMAAWSAASSQFYTDRVVTSCAGPNTTLRFLPWLPFGLKIDPTDACLTNPQIACDADKMVPDCQGGDNNGYNMAVANTYNFWVVGDGTTPPTPWYSFFTLMDHVLFQVKAHGLTIQDFDLQNEVDLLNFTVEARLIYDNTNSVDVLGALRTKMNANFPDSGSRVTFSTTLTRPKQAQAPYTDCNSFYGDKAMIILESERRAAFSNGPIGTPDFGLNPDPSLPCGGTQGTMIQLGPIYSQPSVINIHAYPCIEGPACDAPTPEESGDATLVAKDFYSGVWTYLQRYSAEWSWADRKVMFGEVSPTHNSDPTPPSCNETYRNIRAYNNVNGFMQSTLPGSQAGPNTVLRVWYNIQNPCYAQSGLPPIKPPYGH